jgi:hypothetical protein
MDWPYIVTVLYAIAGIIGVSAYVPQFWALWNDNSGSRNVPISTWLIWCGQLTIYTLYATVVNGDPMYVAITLLTLVATFACAGMLLYNRFYRKITYNRRASDTSRQPATPTTPAPSRRRA